MSLSREENALLMAYERENNQRRDARLSQDRARLSLNRSARRRSIVKDP